MPTSPAASRSADRSGADSGFEPSGFERTIARHTQGRWLGWRRRTLVAVALLGCVGIFWVAHWLATLPLVDAEWRTGPGAALVLESSPLPALQAKRGRSLVAVSGSDDALLAVDATLLHRSPRWQVHDEARALQVAQHSALAAMLAAGPVRLHFDDGREVELTPAPRGWAGLGWLFWPLALLALLLLLAGAVVVLARPRRLNLLFLAMAGCQAVNLMFIALENTPGLGLPATALAQNTLLRVALDGTTGAAAVTALALHPQRLRSAGLIAAAAWGAVGLWLLAALSGLLAPLWWWAQALCLGLSGAALAIAVHSNRLDRNAYTLVMRRFAAVMLATLALVTLAVALAAGRPGLAHGVAAAASVTWYLFLASLLLLTPFLARSRQLLREFALLAGISTLATSLDLLFAAVFSLGAFTSLALALFIALALYAGARQWILNHVAGSQVPTTERTFELLYRTARELRAQPTRYPQLLGKLLRELFEPAEVFGVDRVPARTRVTSGGMALVVPVRGSDDEAMPASALALLHAQRGRRLFTVDDARLVDRVLDQLRRAVAYDQAVERGRNEERMRLAQDLHDDIGARLLTLMYQAPTPEMEDYIRHTLQDLKTLTRGLAAAEHRLSHASVEWRTDLTHRLAAAQAQLVWSFQWDRDMRMTVVQWSALTRVLRELVSNALYHGHAAVVEVHAALERGQLRLRVADDGRGRDPPSWAHGLGLGGVRKRVKVLGGEVRWRENEPRGIVCEVQVDGFDRRS